MWKILLREFISDMKVQRTRAFLTMFAITWGTIAVVLLVAFGEGLGTTMRNGLLNAGDRIFQVYGGETSQEFEGLPKGRRIRLQAADLNLVMKNIPDIDAGSVSYGKWGTNLEVGKTRTTTFMEAVDPSFEDLRRMFPAAGGRFLNDRDNLEKRRVVFLGDEIAARLFGRADVVGEVVMIDGLPFTVVGVMQKKLQTSMNNGPDANRVVIPSTTFEAINGWRYVSHLIVRPRSVHASPMVKAELYRILGSRYKFDPTDERALGVWDFIEQEKIGARVFMGITIFLGAVGGLTLLLAGVGVANIMYVTVRERTREFGVKRALGARKYHIKLQVVFEALLLSIAGGATGLAISSAVIGGMRSIPNKEGAMQFLANPTLSLPVALTTVGVLLLIGLVAGYFPARKAASVDPVDALRFE
jgi:putative ABC transport system permease protein